MNKQQAEINENKHFHEKNNDHDHSHSNLNFLGENTELYFAIISGICWISGAVLSFTTASEYLVTSLFIIGASFGAVFTIVTAGIALSKGVFKIDFLML